MINNNNEVNTVEKFLKNLTNHISGIIVVRFPLFMEPGSQLVFTRPSIVVFSVGQKVSLQYMYSIFFVSLFVFPPHHHQ
jgi:hypothetical protein